MTHWKAEKHIFIEIFFAFINTSEQKYCKLLYLNKIHLGLIQIICTIQKNTAAILLNEVTDFSFHCPYCFSPFSICMMRLPPK
jgi:hypothetical protein